MTNGEEATLRISAQPADIQSLADWFAHERKLRAAVSFAAEEGSGDTLGAVEDIVLHVVSPGVLGAAFGSLSVWLTQQRSDVSITIKSGDTEVSLDAKRVKDTPEVVDRAQALFDTVARADGQPPDEPDGP